MRIKYNFNMVEIALATAVIAIGISSILVLFPIGINATRAAMEENCYSDAVETVTAFVKSEFIKSWASSWNSEPSNIFPSNRPNSSNSYKTKLSITEEVKVGSNTEYSGLIGSGTPGDYKFTRLGRDGEEIFSAEVKIWLANSDLKESGTDTASPVYIPFVEDGSMRLQSQLSKSGETELGLDLEKFAQSVLVEISWRDEVRTFRIDVYNPYFKIVPSA